MTSVAVRILSRDHYLESIFFYSMGSVLVSTSGSTVSAFGNMRLLQKRNQIISTIRDGIVQGGHVPREMSQVSTSSQQLLENLEMTFATLIFEYHSDERRHRELIVRRIIVGIAIGLQE
jgi:hypothetical protein